MKNISIFKFFLAFLTIALIGAGLTLIEKNIQSAESGLEHNDRMRADNNNDALIIRSVLPSSQSAKLRSSSHQATTEPKIATANTVGHRNEHRAILRQSVDQTAYNTNPAFFKRYANESLSIQSDMSTLIASAAISQTTSNTQTSLVSLSVPFSNETSVAPSFAPSAISAGGDPGTDPTGPPLPIGNGLWLLVILAAGYGTRRIRKN